MEMKVLKKDDEMIELEYEINKEEWQAKLDEVYQQERGKYNVEGFRKGKAPRGIIEKTHGDNVFFNDAFSSLVSNYYIEYLTNNKDLRTTCDHPHFDIDDISQDGVKFRMFIELMPKIILGAYKGLEFKKVSHEVSDEMVEQELKKAQASLVANEKIDEDRPVELGDIAIIDFSGMIDGVRFDGGSAEDYSLKIGSKSFIDTFEDQIIGHKVGDTFDVNVKFPAEYGAKQLAGKDAVFYVSLNEIKKEVLPELNDEFAKKLGNFEDFASLKAFVKKTLVDTAKRQASIAEENNMLEQILKSSQVKVPASLLEHNFEYALKDFENRLSAQGLDIDAYSKYINKTKQEIENEIKSQTEKGVKARLIRDEIVSIEKIQVLDEEVENKVQELAKNMGKTTQEFKKTLQKNQIDLIIDEVVADKFFEYLRRENKII